MENINFYRWRHQKKRPLFGKNGDKNTATLLEVAGRLRFFYYRGLTMLHWCYSHDKFTFLQMLFSGDNSGAIRVWETQQGGEDLDSSMASRQNALFWFLKRKLDFKVRPMSFSLNGMAIYLIISFATHRNWATIRSPIWKFTLATEGFLSSANRFRHITLPSWSTWS